jgi:hypothetical protein
MREGNSVRIFRVVRGKISLAMNEMLAALREKIQEQGYACQSSLTTADVQSVLNSLGSIHGRQQPFTFWRRDVVGGGTARAGGVRGIIRGDARSVLVAAARFTQKP